jgi:hypothetical protein
MVSAGLRWPLPESVINGGSFDCPNCDPPRMPPTDFRSSAAERIMGVWIENHSICVSVMNRPRHLMIFSGDLPSIEGPNECVICKGETPILWQYKCTESGEYAIFRCRTCETGFAWPRPDDQEIVDLYCNPVVRALELKPTSSMWATIQRLGATRKPSSISALA